MCICLVILRKHIQQQKSQAAIHSVLCKQTRVTQIRMLLVCWSCENTRFFSVCLIRFTVEFCSDEKRPISRPWEHFYCFFIHYTLPGIVLTIQSSSSLPSNHYSHFSHLFINVVLFTSLQVRLQRTCIYTFEMGNNTRTHVNDQNQ